MELKNYNSMDINILFSIINMKLRDEFDCLEELTAYFDIPREGLVERMEKNGFFYHEDTNQFRRV